MITQRQGISKKYLKRIVTLVNSADILRANRGSLNGITLQTILDERRDAGANEYFI